MAKDIFFSYGHDEYKEFVLKVKDYLEKEGFDVFVDSDKLHSGDDWEYKLEQGIVEREKVIFFITPHAARRPDGYCLNEIAMALAHGKKIYPVMVRNHILPLSLIRKQFLDMQSCVLDNSEDKNSIFVENMKRLVEALNNNDEFEHGDIQSKVIKELEPIDFQLDYAMHGRIIGREWIMNKVDDWLDTHTKSKVLWIIADAGYGKSAISAYLSRHPKVMNVHFCSYNNPQKNKPENVIKSLAYSLQNQQIDGYLEEIQYVNTKDMKAFELFEELISNPLSKVRAKGSTYILVIDGLDETLTDEKRELVTLLGSEEFQYGLPDFVKIIITSRPDPKLRQALSRLNPLELNTKQIENKEDCQEYIKTRLNELNHKSSEENRELIDVIMDKSDANMLYLTKFFEQENIDLSQSDMFPKGLDGIYMNFFRRITTNIDTYDQEFAPLIEVMLAYNEAIPKILLQDILEINRKKLHRLLGSLGSMIREHDGKLDFYHKSLTDWLISENNEDYFVDIDEGQKRLNGFLESLTSQSYKEEYLEFTLFNKMLVDSIYAKGDNLARYFELIKDKESVPIQIILFNDLGTSYNLVNQTQKAIACLEYVFKMEQTLINNKEHVEPSEYNRTLEKLSILYWKVSRVDESLELRHEYISYTKILYDSDDMYAKDYSKALYLLSSAYVQLNLYDKAYELRSKCLEIRKKFYRIDPEKWVELYTTSLLGVAGIYRRTNRYNEAIPLGLEVIKLRKELYEKDLKKWANSYGSALQNVAIYYSGIGETENALELSSETVEIKRKLFNENPARHAASYTVNLNNLAIYHNNLGRYKEALKLQKECLDIRKKLYMENPDRWTAYYAGILKNIGITYRHMGDLDKAIEHMEKGHELRKIVYDKAPDRWIKYYSSALSSLSITYRKAKKYDKALDVGIEALKIRKKKYIENNDGGVKNYVLSLDNIAKTYIDLNQLDKANKYAQISYELRKKYYEQTNTDKWKKYYASGLLTLSKSINDIENITTLMKESVQLREELYETQGDLRKEFYINGLEELAKLYENRDMEEELRSVEMKVNKLRG